jgi:hypothetical protein
MNDKKKFLIVSLVVLATLSFFLGHFWNCAIFALQKAVASGVLPLAIPKFLAGIGITGMHFLL